MLLVIADIESTGLTPGVHEPWEVAFLRDAGDSAVEYVWRWLPNGRGADANALRMNGFYERTEMFHTTPHVAPVAYWCSELGDVDDEDPHEWVSEVNAARAMARLTATATIVGANPGFDVAMLGPWMTARRAVPAWHYRPVDIEALLAGMLGVHPEAWPWDSAALSLLVGVDPAAFDRHSALGDVRWTAAMLAAWRERTSPPEPKATTKATRRRAKGEEPVPDDDGPLTVPLEEEESPPPEEVKVTGHDAQAKEVTVQVAPAAEEARPVEAVSQAAPAHRIMPEGWPEDGELHTCAQCGYPIVDSAGNADTAQAQFSFTMFQKTLCRKCHRERQAVTRG